MRVDVAEVNGRIFLNNSSLGIYPRMVRERDEEQRRGRNKWLAFLDASISVLENYLPLHVRLRANGKNFSRTTPFVFIGNNKYEMEGLHIRGRRRLDAGELCLYVSNRRRHGRRTKSNEYSVELPDPSRCSASHRTRNSETAQFQRTPAGWFRSPLADVAGKP